MPREHLEVLRQALRARGVRSSLLELDSERPYLHLEDMRDGVHIQAPSKTLGADEPFFTWSGGLSIAPVRHVESAAERIAYVLSQRWDRS
jgi:hypothetical protein